MLMKSWKEEEPTHKGIFSAPLSSLFLWDPLEQEKPPRLNIVLITTYGAVCSFRSEVPIVVK